MKDKPGTVVVCNGRFAQFMSTNGWEFIRRKGCSGVVGIMATTEDNCLLLVEQFRPPLGRNVIEIPAGLVGDGTGDDDESVAARRELLEETGYLAPTLMIKAWEGPTTTGLSSETISIFFAIGCTPVGKGGGVDDEKIIVHKVPLKGIDFWLADQERAGKMIDLKVRLARYCLGVR